MKITTPTLLIDEEKARRNIRRMAEKAQENGATFRPHFKTHQSADVGKWFWEEGIRQITVSSVSMAYYFASAGWEDITIAFPYNPLEHVAIEQLAQTIHLNLLVTNKAGLDHLNAHVDASLGYFIKVDVGTHRTGVLPSEKEEIKRMADSKNPKHQLKGLLAHAGHTYRADAPNLVTPIFRGSMDAFAAVRNTISRHDLLISYGDTPSCSLLDSFPGVNEMRPGNFVFYDAMQYSFGVCTLEDIAVCMVCPVVALHPSRSEAVVYGGAVHLSKDQVRGETPHYGLVVRLTDRGWDPNPVAHLDRLSQEHGIVKGSNEFIDALRVGDLIGILPVHSCLTADLQGSYLSLDGQQLAKLTK